jgi:hypothetical protein
VSFPGHKNAPEAKPSGRLSGAVRRTFYEVDESLLRAQGHCQLELPDLSRFPLRQLLEQVAHAGDRGRLADLNDLGHVLTSMIDLYAAGEPGRYARRHTHL